MATDHELRVLREHSNERLAKGELTREAKKEHLYSIGYKKDVVEKTLAELYPEESDAVQE